MQRAFKPSDLIFLGVAVTLPVLAERVEHLARATAEARAHSSTREAAQIAEIQFVQVD